MIARVCGRIIDINFNINKMQITGQIEVIRDVVVEHDSTDSFQDKTAPRKLFFALFGKAIETSETNLSIIGALKTILFDALQSSGLIGEVNPVNVEYFKSHLEITEGRQIGYIRPGGIGFRAMGMLYFVSYGLGQNLVTESQVTDNPQNHLSNLVIVLKTEFEQIKAS